MIQVDRFERGFLFLSFTVCEICYALSLCKGGNNQCSVLDVAK